MPKTDAYGFTPGQGKFEEDIVYSLALLYSLIFQNISDYLSPFDMSVGKFNLLMIVKHRGGTEGLKQVEISRHLILTPSNMTKLIDKLEEDKLVERFAQEGDRRVNLIRITTRGSKLLDDIWPGYVKVLKQATQSLSAAQQKQLAGLLTGWFESIR